MHMRNFRSPADFIRIGDFLVETYQPGDRFQNWRQSRWEYMFYHPMLDAASLGRIAIWEDEGRIVGVANYEGALGEAYFHLRPGYEHLKPEMLAYAEANLAGVDEKGRNCLTVYINDFDTEFAATAGERGYQREEGRAWMSRFDIAEPFPAIELPEGYRLQSLAEENDLHKVNRVLYRGFNHEGPPPEEDLPGRRSMQSAPNWCGELNLVVVAPSGEYVAYCGMWYDPVHRVCDVEPVATDPDYRGRGLGKAAVLEGIRRCKELGATAAWVGSGQKFYEAIGFRKMFAHCLWTKRWDA